MEPFDLDALASAKAEALDEGLAFTFHGTEFTCPPVGEFAWDTLERLDENLRAGLSDLLGAQADKFWEFQPSVVEVWALRDELIQRYAGAIAGESAASPVSGNRASRRSRQRSPKPTQASAKAPSP